jgi:hypothetical protein
MSRPWVSNGLTHDLVEALASVGIVLFFLASGWSPILGALIASPGVPLGKAVLHASRRNSWRHILKDGFWELLIWGTGWWMVYRGGGVEALGTFVLWYLALTVLRHFTKLGSP